MTIQEEKNENENDRQVSGQMQNIGMNNQEFKSAAADSDEEGDEVDELVLNQEIQEENDEKTTQIGARKFGVPEQMVDDMHSDTFLFSL